MSLSLIDPHARVIDYLRISITDLCNFRCVYCRPPEGVTLISHDEILRYEEILTFVKTACDMGIRKVRVTGGEPLVRRGVLDFLSRLTRIEQIEDVGLTTNGTRLAAMAEDLKKTGLKRINVSLDTLRREVFERITGKDSLAKVWAGIEAALDKGFKPVKINVVLLQGINETDIPEFARLTLNLPVDIRFIEQMPFGKKPMPESPASFSAGKALDMIREECGDLIPLGRDPMDGPAAMFRLAEGKGRIGVIAPMTGHFCGTCNRLRLTARGTLRPCLLGSNEIDVRSLLRNGASREKLADVIRRAVSAKPGRHPVENPETAESMHLIGG